MKRNYLVGRRFEKLFVIAETGRTNDRHIKYECVCECGNRTNVSGSDLLSGHTKSCGCLERIKHGGRIANKTERLYFVWSGMRERCRNPLTKNYANYGGRGIKVCDEWNEYERFREWALANGYDANAKYGHCTLDRIDVDGNYEPSNCRWTTASVQMFNRRIGKSKLGVRGVYYRECESKYYAMITKDRKQMYLGRFDSLDEAIAVRKNAEMKYYGVVLDGK